MSQTQPHARERERRLASLNVRRGVLGRCCVREADREDVIERESQLEDATLAVLDTIQASAKARSETAEGVPPATNGSHA